MAEFLEKITILPCRELKRHMLGWLWKMLSTWNQQNSRKKTRKTHILSFKKNMLCIFASDQWLVQNSPEWKSMWWPPPVCLPLICEKTTRFFPASFYAPGFPWSVPWPNWWTPQSANTQAKSSVFWRRPLKLRRYLVNLTNNFKFWNTVFGEGKGWSVIQYIRLKFKTPIYVRPYFGDNWHHTSTFSHWKCGNSRWRDQQATPLNRSHQVCFFKMFPRKTHWKTTPLWR